jgi:predicted DNA-binding protein (MmcQ/YjbR family)
MNFEENIFKRCSVNFSKLLAYGFKKENDCYFYSKIILNNTFRVDIMVNSQGLLSGKVIDLAFNEEYNNFRMENNIGSFASKIRNEYETILLDIKTNCYISHYFIGNQANRITNLILKKYGDKPEFLWAKSPYYGVFRNTNNQKWYAIIMNINSIKLNNKNKEVEIINLKLNDNEIINLLNKKGFYKAYHMNKKYWITIILDDTISDEEIMIYLLESYNLNN